MNSKIYPRVVSFEASNDVIPYDETNRKNIDEEKSEHSFRILSNRSERKFTFGQQNSNKWNIFSTARKKIENLLLRATMPKETFDKAIERRFYELALEEQTVLHEKKENLFYWVRKGDLNSLKEKIHEKFEHPGLSSVPKKFREKEIIDVRDAAGANIIHMAYLLGNYVIGHWLVETYPWIALLPYSGKLSEELRTNKPEVQRIKNVEELMPYTGENILHMVIVRRDYEEVRWLLDFYKGHRDSIPHGLAILLTSKATGKFFDQKGSFYFGGYPLQFAVCSNSIEIFDLVLSYASSLAAIEVEHDYDQAMFDERYREFQSLGPNVIFMRDSFGNTVLHLCVIHCLVNMYKHVYKIAQSIIERELKLLYVNVIQNDQKANELNTYELSPHDTNDSTVGFSLISKKLRCPRHGKFEEWVSYEAKVKMEERLVLALNVDWHSPLTLAASQIKRSDIPAVMDKKIKMLTYILQEHRKIIYDYGLKVLCEINLDGLEIKYNLSNYDMTPAQRKTRHKHRSAIDWLCRCGAESAVTMPDIRRVIEGKWKRWGLNLLMTKCILSCVTNVAVTSLSVLLSVDPTPTPSTVAEALTTIFYLILWIMFSLLFLEAAMLAYNQVQWDHMRGVPRFHLVCKIVKIFSFAIFCYFRVNQSHLDEDGSMHFNYPVEVKSSLALCIIACWLHLYYYLMAFESTGPLMLTVTTIIGRDIPNFLKFYFITVIAFACGVTLIADKTDCDATTGIVNLFRTFWALLQETLHPLIPPSVDNADISIVSENLKGANDFMITAYHGIGNIIMFNMLLGIVIATYEFSTTYNVASKAHNNEATFLIAKYNIMEFFELYFWKKNIYKKVRSKYCVVHKTDRQYSPIDDPLYDGSQPENDDQAEPTAEEITSTKSIIPPEFLTYRHIFQVEEKQQYWTEGAKTESVDILHSNTSVFIIDPQMDFHRGGSFPIEGAVEDSQRIASMIKNNKFFIHNIFVALDTHYEKHIAHATFWRDKYGNKPPISTKISYSDIKLGTWTPREPEDLEWCLKYTKDLERKGRLKLTIWPEHCILGTRGHAVVPVINDALQEWALHSKRPVQYIFKGYNYRTEMYSALEAEIVDPNDYTTSLNEELLSMLRISDKLLICGQSLSHSINFTLRDLIRHWRGDLSKLILLEDGCSPLPEFSHLAYDLKYDLKADGVTISNTKAFFSNLTSSEVMEEHSNIISTQELYAFEAEALRKSILRRSVAVNSTKSVYLQDSAVNIFQLVEAQEDNSQAVISSDPSNKYSNKNNSQRTALPSPSPSPTSLWSKLMKGYETVFKPNKAKRTRTKDINFMRDYILRQESELRNDSNSVFYWVALGDVIAFQDKMMSASFRSQLHEVDPTGASIILKAYMCKFYQMGRWMVENYPFMALKPYSNRLPPVLAKMGYSPDHMPFTGLNILHIVILRREYEELRWLLDFYKDHRDSIPNGLAHLLQCSITGYSFRYDGDYYFGCLPLHFAVCCNSIEIFDLVLSYSASLENDVTFGSNNDRLKEFATLGQNVIFMRDSVGNTVLHLCAIHGLESMFEHVYKTAESIVSRELKVLYAKNNEVDKNRTGLYDLVDVSKGAAGYRHHSKKIRLPVQERYHEWLHLETKVKMEERLMLALNKDLHSPLTLAASTHRRTSNGKDNIFKSLIMSQKKPLWNFGPIICSELALDGIETGYNLEKFEPKYTGSKKAFSATTWLCLSGSEESIILPEVKSLIKTKWRIFGLPLFVLQSVFDLSITILVTFQLIFINFGPTLYPKSALDYFINIIYAATFILFSWNIIEKMEIIRRHPSKLFSFHAYGVARFHVLITNIKIVSFSLFFAFQLMDAYNATRFKSSFLKDHIHDSHMVVLIAMTFCTMSSWLHLYYYLMGFETTGPFLLVLSRIVVNDVPYFMQFLVFLLLGFASAIAMVANNSSNYANVFWKLCEIIFGLIQKSVLLLPYSTYPAGLIDANAVDANLFWLQDILITVYYGIVIFVFITTLIAIMTKTFVEYSHYNEAYFLIEKYNVMEYFEQHMTEQELVQHKQSYCTKKLHHHEQSPGEHAHNEASLNFKASYSFEVREVMQDWLNMPPTLSLEDSKTFKKTSLLIIDPQVDLHPGGSLPIPGAQQCSERIASIIRKNKHYIHEIFVSLKANQVCHITHASFWRSKNGKKPPPYTIISHNDVKSGVWAPHDRTYHMRDWCQTYTKELERKGRAKLTIWPDHCIIGSKGCAVEPCINEALQEWAAHSKKSVTYIMKGLNSRTEMHSALEAEVVDPHDYSTALNSDILSLLRVADRLIICGQAMSHAVNATLRDLVNHWRGDKGKLEFLQDGSACMEGYAAVGQMLLYDLKTAGVRIVTSADAFPELGDAQGDDEESVHEVPDIEEIDEIEEDDFSVESKPPEEKHTDKYIPSDFLANKFSAYMQLKLASGNFFLQFLNVPSADPHHEFNEKLLRLQTIQHSDVTKLFHWVQSGDLNTLKDKIEELKTDLTEIDAAGANIIHLAYLYEWYHIGHWLVETYPELALVPYSNKLPVEMEEYSKTLMPYSGENILHMVIVRRNYGEVRWLLDFYRHHRDSVPHGLARLLMTANATGTFFDPKGDFYFGGYPLQFAVCSNNQDIFDLVLSFASSVDTNSSTLDDDGLSDSSIPNLGPNVIFMRDSCGNTLLHLCVIHGLSKMYDHILEIATTVISRELQFIYGQKRLELSDEFESFALSSYDSMSMSSGYNLPSKPLQLPSQDMYEKWLVSEVRTKLYERLLLVLNNDLFCPLTLAAKLSTKTTSTVSEANRISMMKTVLSSTNRDSRSWSFGPLLSSRLNLKGIDIEHDFDDYYSPDANKCKKAVNGNSIISSFLEKKVHLYSAIKWICINGDNETILLPEIKSIIDSKWERYGLHQFVFGYLLDLVLTLLITLLTIFINTGPTLHIEFEFEIFVNILYIITTLVFLCVFYFEMKFLIKQYKQSLDVHGVAWTHLLFRRIKVASYFIFLAFRLNDASDHGWKNIYMVYKEISLPESSGGGHHRMMASAYTPTDETHSMGWTYNPQDYPGAKSFLSLCVVLCWLNIYYYMVGFKLTGPFMLTFKNALSIDLPYFCRFYSILLAAFAACISMLANQGYKTVRDNFFYTWESLLCLVQKAVFLPPFQEHILISHVNLRVQWLANILLTGFYLLAVIVMLNLLIAIITDTHTEYSSYDESIFLIEKYYITDFYEKLLSPEELEKQRDKYCTIEEVSEEFISMDENGDEQTIVVKTKEFNYQMVEVIADWFSSFSGALLKVSHVAKTSLLIIDPQVDLHPGGAFSISGASKDSQRIADMIKKNKHLIHEIFVSLESRFVTHISHSNFWVNSRGENPPPNTVISYAAIKSGQWFPRNNSSVTMNWCLAYTRALERKRRSKLKIRPVHCIIGGRGHTVVPVINEALQEWAAYSNRTVTYIFTGQNSRTEMLSILEAEVEDPLDSSTAFNSRLMSMFRAAERLLVCGEALNHRVKYSILDIAKHWQGNMDRIVLLEDGSSPMNGYEMASSEIKKLLVKEGITISLSTAAFADFGDVTVTEKSGIDDTQLFDLEEQLHAFAISTDVNTRTSLASTNYESSRVSSRVSKKRSTKTAQFQKVEKTDFLAHLQTRFENFILPFFSISADLTRKTFMDTLLKINASIYNDRQRLFYFAKMGDIFNLKEQLQLESKRHQTDTSFLKFLMSEVDAFGANIIHVAYFNEFYEMGHWLVATYPELALKPYEDNLPPQLKAAGYTKDLMPYTGENILHMVIVRRNYEEVRWILDFFKDHKDSVPDGLAQLLLSDATGKFFDVKGDFYFGGYPLQFAVCSNSIEIFDLVLSFASTTDVDIDDDDDESEKSASTKITKKSMISLGPNVIFMRDSYGNTVLHLCVRHCLENMFDHVYNVARTTISREIKLQYINLKTNEAEVDTEFHLKSDKEIERNIRTGYAVKYEKLYLPSDDNLDEWLAKETSVKINERLLLVLNNELHSPLTLASTIKQNDENDQIRADRVAMLTFLMKRLKNVLWQYGPTQCYEVNLEGLEVKYSLADYSIQPTEMTPNHESVISWLCIHDVEAAIMIPEIRRIVEVKWERCGLPTFLSGFVIDTILVVLITLLLVFDTHAPDGGFGFYYFMKVLYLSIIVIYMLLVYEECRHVNKYRKILGRLRGIAWYHVICRSLKMVSFIVYCIAKVITLGITFTALCSIEGIAPKEEPSVVKIPLLVCVLVCWYHLYFYLMCFESTGLYVLTLSRIVVRDVPHFLRFYVISLFAFTSPISMLGNSGNYRVKYSFWQYIRTIWSMINQTVIRIPVDDRTLLIFVPEDLRLVSDMWNTIFFYAVAFVMINLLIATIISTYNFYTKFNESTNGFNNEAILLIEKFNVMDFYEQHLNDEELHEHRGTYAISRILERPKEIKPPNIRAPQLSMRGKADSTVSNQSNFPGVLKRNGTFYPLAESLKAVKHEEEISAEPMMKYFFQYEEEIRGWLHESNVAVVEEGSHRNCLMLIEPQMDFQPGGPMAVAGAEEEWKRVADMIKTNKNEIYEILVVLDSHYSPFHISNAKFWVNKNGNHPKNKTIISYENVKNGVWMPKDNTPEMLAWCLHYTAELERLGRMKLTIWPEHCIVGGKGHTIVPVINDALSEWAAHSKRTVTFIMKGQNRRTDMFSAIQAEVEDPHDNSTTFNADLMSTLQVSERLVLCGPLLAQSFQQTLRDIVSGWRGDTSRVVLLKSVPTNSKLLNRAVKQLLYDMLRDGVRLLDMEKIFRPSMEMHT